jgi:hypothetical protein
MTWSRGPSSGEGRNSVDGEMEAQHMAPAAVGWAVASRHAQEVCEREAERGGVSVCVFDSSKRGAGPAARRAVDLCLDLKTRRLCSKTLRGTSCGLHNSSSLSLSVALSQAHKSIHTLLRQLDGTRHPAKGGLREWSKSNYKCHPLTHVPAGSGGYASRVVPDGTMCLSSCQVADPMWLSGDVPGEGVARLGNRVRMELNIPFWKKNGKHLLNENRMANDPKTQTQRQRVLRPFCSGCCRSPPVDSALGFAREGGLCFVPAMCAHVRVYGTARGKL